MFQSISNARVNWRDTNPPENQAGHAPAAQTSAMNPTGENPAGAAQVLRRRGGRGNVQRLFQQHEERRNQLKATLAAAIFAGDLAGIFNAVHAARSSNERFSNAEARPLLDLAMEQNASLQLKRALLSLPGVQPNNLLDVAVAGNDLELATHLLGRGATVKPELVYADISAPMRKLLRTAGNAQRIPGARNQVAFLEMLGENDRNRMFSRLPHSARIDIARHSPAFREQLTGTERSMLDGVVHIHAGTPQISTEAIRKIKDHVLQGLQDWDFMYDAFHRRNTEPLRQDHKLLGLFMDGLYKHHFQGAFSLDRVPDDETLKAACRIALENVPDEYKDAARGVIANFDPKARETFAILYERFEELPRLQDIAPENRFRLLVDPIKVDMLAQQGLDPDNPCLAFIFENETGGRFANKSAKGLVAVAENLHKPISAELVKTLHAANCGSGFTPEGKAERYGARFTPAGVRTLSAFLQKQALNHGVQTSLELQRRAFFVGPDGMAVANRNRNESGEAALRARHRSYPINHLEALLLDAAEMSPSGPTVINITRNSIPDATSEEIIKEIVERFQEKAAHSSTPEEKLLASNTMYLEGDYSHLYINGNWRTWGRDLYYLSLEQQGESFAILYDPLGTEGMSPEELVAQAQDGQRRWQSWLKPELRSQTESGPSSR